MIFLGLEIVVVNEEDVMGGKSFSGVALSGRLLSDKEDDEAVAGTAFFLEDGELEVDLARFGLAALSEAFRLLSLLHLSAFLVNDSLEEVDCLVVKFESLSFDVEDDSGSFSVDDDDADAADDD